MEPHAFQRYLDFNQQLSALAAAGVPLDMQVPAADIPDLLSQYAAHVALECGRGATLESVLQQQADWPAAYRSAAATLLQGGSCVAALQAVHGPAADRQPLLRPFRGFAASLLIVVSLALAGGFLLVTRVAPRLDDTYQALGLRPSGWAEMLLRLRLYYPWLVAAGIVLMAGFFWGVRRGWIANPLAELPPLRRYLAAKRCALFARELALLLAGGSSAEIACETARQQASGQPLSVRPARPGALPAISPLLTWVLHQSEPPDQLKRNLQRAATFYERIARREIETWHTTIPIVAAALLGGSVVLLYALALFKPLIQLLIDLSASLV